MPPNPLPKMVSIAFAAACGRDDRRHVVGQAQARRDEDHCPAGRNTVWCLRRWAAHVGAGRSCRSAVPPRAQPQPGSQRGRAVRAALPCCPAGTIDSPDRRPPAHCPSQPSLTLVDVVDLQSSFNPRTSDFDVPLRVPTWLVSLIIIIVVPLLHLGGCAQAHFSIPNPPPSANTQSGFDHYAHMLPEQKPRIQPPPSPPS